MNYGCNLLVGRFFYANFGCTILDETRVTIGDGVLMGPNVKVRGGAGGGYRVMVWPERRAARVWRGPGAVPHMHVRRLARARRSTREGTTWTLWRGRRWAARCW